MVKEEIWSIPLSRVRDFFLQQSDVLQLGPQDFSFGSCRILLSALPPGGSGMWKRDRTSVRLEGNAEDTALIYRRFFLQFLSAGG